MAKLPGVVKVVDEDYVLSFGKHKGASIGLILECEPSYILWLDDNITAFKIEKYIIQEAEAEIDGGDFDELDFE